VRPRRPRHPDESVFAFALEKQKRIIKRIGLRFYLSLLVRSFFFYICNYRLIQRYNMEREDEYLQAKRWAEILRYIKEAKKAEKAKKVEKVENAKKVEKAKKVKKVKKVNKYGNKIQ
jgi:hypothetical protein